MDVHTYVINSRIVHICRRTCAIYYLDKCMCYKIEESYYIYNKHTYIHF